MEYKNIVERLSQIRTVKKLSSRELGLMIGKSDTYFYKIENQSIKLSVLKLLEILETLEVDTEKFFYKDFYNYEEDMKILSLIKSMPESKKQNLIELLKNK